MSKKEPPDNKISFTSIIAADFADRCKAFMVADLARSGLTPDDIPCEPEKTPGVVGPCYRILYFLPDGTPVPEMWRQRNAEGKNKYLSPSRETIGDACAMPYFCPLRLTKGNRNGTYVIVEGEKKYAKLLKETGLYGCAIGGKDNWRDGDGGLNQMLYEDIAAHMPERILIVPDGDWRRQDIFSSYSLLVYSLQRRFPGVQVQIADLSAWRTADDKRVGIDDYLMADLKWADVPLVALENELLLDTGTLIERFSLDFDTSSKGIRTIRANHSNTQKLLSQHPMFGPAAFWFDADNNTPVFNDDGRNWLVNLAICLQRYCGMPTVSVDTVKWAAPAIYDLRIKSLRAEWMKGLVWDGVKRIEKMFVDCVKTDQPPETYRNEAAKRVMLQMVARCLEPGCKADTMVVLIGSQGVRKSMFWEELSKGSYATLGSDVNAKDTQMLVNSNFVIVLGELDWLSKTENSKVKRFITERKDDYRPPYRHSLIKQLRKCVFVGDSNDMGILRDGQNRRFMPVIVSEVDLKWLRENVDQLYAEAVALYRAGERWWSEDESAWEEAKEIFQEGIPYEVEIDEALDQVKKAGGAHLIPNDFANEILRGKEGYELKVVLAYINKTRNMTPKYLGSLLGRMGYEVRRVKIDEIQKSLWFKKG